MHLLPDWGKINICWSDVQKTPNIDPRLAKARQIYAVKWLDYPSFYVRSLLNPNLLLTKRSLLFTGHSDLFLKRCSRMLAKADEKIICRYPNGVLSCFPGFSMGTTIWVFQSTGEISERKILLVMPRKNTKTSINNKLIWQSFVGVLNRRDFINRWRRRRRRTILRAHDSIHSEGSLDKKFATGDKNFEIALYPSKPKKERI